MTLYWWMHWFWVTAQIAGCTVIGASSSTTDQLSEDVTVTSLETIVTRQQSFPNAKELSYSDTTTVSSKNKYSVPPTVAGIGIVNLTNRTADVTFDNVTQVPPEIKSGNEKAGTISKNYAVKKDSWKSGNKAGKIKLEDATKSPSMTREDHLTVVPLNVENSGERDRLSHMNNSKVSSSLTNNSNNQINKKYTEKLVVESVSQNPDESSRLNRARGTLFTIGLQRDLEANSKHYSKLSNSNDESSIGIYSNNGTSPTEIAIITLSCLATLVLLSTAGSLGFIMYRRKYLNPPQTLNSDKCSNPDSSGYIDDSTIRDNSEEMYSLDNDSFLNSLEAMTIQNYWTDSVKHTKL